ncbi:MAG TPA: GyrI-like domain-containing protein [Niabella sp.]|nr:GyrI-like domain-containing protein [Niabella sp.]
MPKLNLQKEFKNYYSPSLIPQLLLLPAANYLSICGSGIAGDGLFNEQTEALFKMAYSIKKITKKLDKDFTVPPLEGIYWKDEKIPADAAFGLMNWELRIRIPDFVSGESVSLISLDSVKQTACPSIAQVLFLKCEAVKCAQLLHIGPYHQEGHSVQQLKDFIQKNDLRISGLHHEIYLNNPNRVSPEKLKTIIRYAVERN